MAPTSSMESVTVIRPLKIIAFICGIISILLLFISICSTSWLEAEEYRQGLWKECYPNEADEMKCHKNEYEAWIVACGALSIITLIIAVVGTVLTGMGLATSNYNTKFLYYRIAMYLMFFAVLCMVIALIVFPAMFMKEIQKRDQNEWYFAWSYGVAWGAAIFLFGAAILLLIDKESEEVYYSEKTYYHETDA